MSLTAMEQKEKEYLEKRIELLENALLDETTLTNVSSGGVSETVDREKLERELDRARARYNALYGKGQIFGVVLH